jgi:hypothetical protein
MVLVQSSAAAEERDSLDVHSSDATERNNVVRNYG